MFWVLETPSFLASVSKLNQAKINLRYIRRGYQQNEINAEFDKLKTYIEDENFRKSHLIVNRSLDEFLCKIKRRNVG